MSENYYNEGNILKFCNSKYLIYVYFFIIFVIVFLTTNPTFRPHELAVVYKIFHPESFDGIFFGINLKAYNPVFNYDYIAAFFAKCLGYEEDLWKLGEIFWVIEKGFTLVIAIMLCDLVFPDDKLTLLIAITLFMSFIDHEATQKSMSWPLYLLAMYYFLKERWIVSAIFSASIFYLHIGVGVWWLGTASFALLAMLLVQKRVSLKQVIGYGFVTIVLSSPIICYYSLKSLNSEIDEFALKYFYYASGWQASVILALATSPLIFFNQWLTFAVCCVGSNKALKFGYGDVHRNIMLLMIGSLTLYLAQFVFADILSSNFIIPMQLTRAFARIILVFGTLFLGFLLATHLRKGHYIFLLVFLFMYLAHRTYKTIIISIIALIIYEIYEKHIKDFIERVSCNLKVDFSYLKKLKLKRVELLQHPIIMAVILLIMFAGFKLSLSQHLKSYIKPILNITTGVNASIAGNKRNAIYEDIPKYFDKESAYKKALILYPFVITDYPPYIPRHNTFISCDSMINNMFFNMKGSGEYRAILENDLNCSIDRLFKDVTNNANAFYDIWGEMWENLDEGIINRWNERYGLTHVIREKDLPLNFPVVYQNSFYVVYEIK